MTNLPNNPYVESLYRSSKELEGEGVDAGLTHPLFGTLAVAYEVNQLAKETRIANLQRERDYYLKLDDKKSIAILDEAILNELRL